MLYYLFYEVLRPYFKALNVFRYITVRTAYASLTALFLALVLGPWLIRRLGELQIGQFIREEGPEEPSGKSGHANHGWSSDRNFHCGSHAPLGGLEKRVHPARIWAPCWLLRAIGFIDDYEKVVRRHNKGLSARAKFGYQVLTSLVAGVVLIALLNHGVYSTQLIIPFFKNFHPDLVVHSLLAHSYLWPLAFVPFLLFIVAGGCRLLECREPYRWSRRTGHRLHDHRRGRANRSHLS